MSNAHSAVWYEQSCRTSGTLRSHRHGEVIPNEWEIASSGRSTYVEVRVTRFLVLDSSLALIMIVITQGLYKWKEWGTYLRIQLLDTWSLEMTASYQMPLAALSALRASSVHFLSVSP